MTGAYILVLRLDKSSKIKIGKLGKIRFEKGYYAYAGSAMGRGEALKNRIRRHQKLAKEKKGKLFWHIDYFLANPDVKITKVLIFKSDKKIECQISQRISKLAKKTIKAFGSSDCRCQGHFHYLGNRCGLKFANTEGIAVY